MVVVPLDGEVGEMPGAALIKSNMLGSPRGDGSEVLGAEAGPESAVSCFDARARALDHDRFREACELQDGRSLDGGAGPDADVLFVIGSQIPASRCRARTRPGGRAGKRSCPFSFVVSCRRAANQRRRADADDRTRKDAALVVLDRSDEGAGQPLRSSHPRGQQDAGGGNEHQQALPQPRRGWSVSLQVHVICPAGPRSATLKNSSLMASSRN